MAKEKTTMEKEVIEKEIERITLSREVDKFNFSNNITIYLALVGFLWGLIEVILEFSIRSLIFLIMFFTISLIIIKKNEEILVDFKRKKLMLDKRYLALGVKVNNLEKERKSITKKDFEEFYK